MYLNVLKVTRIPVSSKQSASLPFLTPELLAASQARFSRSAEGISSIVAKINPADPEQSTRRIFSFLDYGHASIRDLTGQIPVVFENISMYLAYTLFSWAQLGSGQETSTRYLVFDSTRLIDPGFPEALKQSHTEVVDQGFALYRKYVEILTQTAESQFEKTRIPTNISEKQRTRMLSNYVLDRSRYFLPFNLGTNMTLNLTARGWVEVLSRLNSSPALEFQDLAQKLKTQLVEEIPQLLSHTSATAAAFNQQKYFFNRLAQAISAEGCPIQNRPDEVFVSIENSPVDFMKTQETWDSAFEGKQNRYDFGGEKLARMQVRFALNNISLAELRDLNRHRTGFRYSPLIPVGFYLPEDINPNDSEINKFLTNYAKTVKQAATLDPHLVPYVYFFGTQVPFEHSTQGDKIIYQLELRTGLGAHFRYAEHMRKVAHRLINLEPELSKYINLGEAEPE